MKFLIVLLVVTGLAFAQCFSVEMGDLSMVPQRVTLDDLKYTLKNITPDIKHQLDSLLNLLGRSLNDVEKALDNPTDEMRRMFGPAGLSISQMKSMLGNLPGPIKQMLEIV